MSAAQRPDPARDPAPASPGPAAQGSPQGERAPSQPADPAPAAAPPAAPPAAAPPPVVRPAPAGAAAEREEEFLRFSGAQRIQHFILMFSMLLLMVTGLPLFFPQNPIVQKVFFFAGSFRLRGIAHRVGAVVLIGLSLFHLGYCLSSERGNSELKEMIPRRKDLRDILRLVQYNLGRRRDRPRYGRFSFTEKFEYWAVAWGSAVMIFTGLMLWFEEATMAVFPKWVLDMLRIIHGYEAILAFLAIIIWHMYNVHLNPTVFPMSKVWLTGKITRREMMENHPLEYERIVRERGERAPEEGREL